MKEKDAAISQTVVPSTHLGADNHAVTAGSVGLLHVFLIRSAIGGVIAVAAARASAVELDTVARAGDAIALAAAAAGRIGRHAAW